MESQRSQEAIRQAVDDHHDWVVSEGETGARASLRSADLSQIDLDDKNLSNAILDNATFGSRRLSNITFDNARLNGADFKKCRLRNVSFKKAQLIDADLSCAKLGLADLERANLARAKLVKADLEEANLRRAVLSDSHLDGSVLHKATLVEADLDGAELPKADLRGANLQDARLEGAKLMGAKLVGKTGLASAVLRHADLSEAIGLFGDDFAGRDLTGARLPADIHGFHTLPIIEEASRNSRTIFLTMLLICAYSWLTIGTTVDYRLVANSASSPLPIIGAPIPIATFYWFAPIVLLAIYIYLHIYLLRLWDGLSRLPAIFPDGRRIDQRVYPWLMTGLVRRHVDAELTDRSVQARIEEFVTIVLAWWTVPFTLFGFWAFYLPRHDWAWTSVHAVLFAISVSIAVAVYQVAMAILKKRGHHAFEVEQVALGNRLGVVALAASFALSFAAIEGIRTTKPWVTATLRDGDVSARPANYWAIGEPKLRDRSVKGADLKGRDLRFADAQRAFLANADLSGANLEGADLSRAILRGADLTGTVLKGAKLEGADLTGVTGLPPAALAEVSYDCETRLPEGLAKPGCRK